MDYEPSPITGVTVRRTEDNWTLLLVRNLNHPPAKVWAAITEPRQLARWAPYTADRNLGSLGDTVITMIDDESPSDIPARVRQLEPLKLLEYTWGGDVLRWELTPSDTGTQLTLLHTVEDKDWIAKVAAGWHICLDVAGHVLDGAQIEPIRGEDAKNHGWTELAARYETLLSTSD